jgi:hypothetical protein
MAIFLNHLENTFLQKEGRKLAVVEVGKNTKGWMEIFCVKEVGRWGGKGHKN